MVRSYEWSTHDHGISQNGRKAQQKKLVAPLTDRNERETRTISSHRTVRRKAHRLLGQKMDLRYPRALYSELRHPFGNYDAILMHQAVYCIN
jgi:hypothetical protein